MTIPEHRVVIDGDEARLVVSGLGWHPALADLIVEQSLTGLSLLRAPEEIGFLEQMPRLRTLIIQGGTPTSLRPIEALSELRYLSLGLSTKRKMEVNFAAMANLDRLWVDWNPGFGSLFEAKQVRELGIDRGFGTDLSALAGLTGLRSLSIGSNRILVTTAGVEALSELRVLKFYAASKLADLAGVEQLAYLTELDIDTCKQLDELDAVASLAALRTLCFNNCGSLKTLRPIAALAGLERFFAWDTTRVVDADLSPLAKLPNLRVLAMQSRREYTPTLETIKGRIEQSNPSLDPVDNDC